MDELSSNLNKDLLIGDYNANLPAKMAEALLAANKLKEINEPIEILHVEDDEDDFLLISEAIKDTGILHNINWVKDGVEAMNYMLHEAEYRVYSVAPKPDLILMDINMPRKNGLETLEELRKYSQFDDTLIMVLSSFVSTTGVTKTYEDYGLDIFVEKTRDLKNFASNFTLLTRYWYEVMRLSE